MGPTGFNQLVGHGFQQGILNPHCKYRGPTGIWDLLVLISWLDMGFNRVFSILTVSTEDLQVYGTYWFYSVGWTWVSTGCSQSSL